MMCPSLYATKYWIESVDTLIMTYGVTPESMEKPIFTLLIKVSIQPEPGYHLMSSNTFPIREGIKFQKRCVQKCFQIEMSCILHSINGGFKFFHKLFNTYTLL